jgi:hypothetical protein
VVGEQVERRRRDRLAYASAAISIDLRSWSGSRRRSAPVLVQPLGGEHLGGVAEAFAAVVETHVDGAERLSSSVTVMTPKRNGMRRRTVAQAARRAP